MPLSTMLKDDNTDLIDTDLANNKLTKIDYLFLSITGFFCLSFLIFAFFCNVHAYDSYEYLNNAQYLIGIKTRYDLVRPPFFSIILLPFALLAKYFNSINILARAPYFLMAISATLALLLMWRFARRLLPSPYASLAILVFALNPIVLHYWPFLMPEITAILMIFSFWLCLRKEKFLWAGICFGTVLTLRYQLTPLFLIGTAYLLINYFNNDKKKMILSIFIVNATAIIFFLMIHFVVFKIAVPDLGLIGGFKDIYQQQTKLFFVGDLGDWAERILRELRTLNYFCTLPTLIFALIGLLISIYRHKQSDIMALCWFLGIFFAIALGVRGPAKDSRYMLPVYPVIYIFAVQGLSIIWRYITSRLQNGNALLRIVLLTLLCLVLAISPLLRALDVIALYQDRSYYKPLASNLGQFLKDNLPADRTAFWVGDYFTIAPIDFQYVPEEKFFYFNLSSNGLSFYTSKLCYSNFNINFINQDITNALVVINKNRCRDCSPANELIFTQTPLTVHKILIKRNFIDSGTKVIKSWQNQNIEFHQFSDGDGKFLYIAEVNDQLLLMQDEAKENIIVQFNYRNEPIPQYADETLFSLPHPIARTDRRNLYGIERVIITELTPPMAVFE